MIYLQLLLSYLKIGFFGFGGGYAMLSLIQNEIVVPLNQQISASLYGPPSACRSPVSVSIITGV